MYDDNFDLFEGDSDTFDVLTDLENTVSDVSGTDDVSDFWLDPVTYRTADVSSNDYEENDTIVEVDLTQIETSLRNIESDCNLFFGVSLFYIVYRFIRSIVYKFNSKGKGIDE